MKRTEYLRKTVRVEALRVDLESGTASWLKGPSGQLTVGIEFPKNRSQDFASG